MAEGELNIYNWGNYTSPEPIEKIVKGDLAAGVNWNGASFRARAQNPENAKIFQNFVMAPGNAALISALACYADGIMGSEAFMPEDMARTPEVVIPDDLKGAACVVQICPPEVQKIYTKLWTELQKQLCRKAGGGPVARHPETRRSKCLISSF